MREIRLYQHRAKEKRSGKKPFRGKDAPTTRQTTDNHLLIDGITLFSLVLTACNAPWAQASKPQPLPTQTAEPGWKIVFQTHGDAMNQSEGKSQNFSLGQVPTSAYYLRLSITCPT
jgi:hypothetical protein